jgi:trimeric autotransporter adhesin
MKINTLPILIALVLACFDFSPIAYAVSPPPDGGYPGGNTAEGASALLSRTTGIYNTAIGLYSLLSLTHGNFNTGVGAGTLLVNTADSNTATGAGALLGNTTGDFNTANGTFTLFSNTTGGANTATGASALQSNTQGDNNTAVGAAALLNNTATGNTAIGSNTLLNNTTGGTLENIQGVDVGPNVAVGWQSLESNTVASANTAVGYQALHSFTTGPVGLEQVGLCTAVGFRALANATGDGIANSAFGYQALSNNSDGGGNTAIGLQALLSNTTGGGNVAIGNNALSNNTAGNSNAALGFNAGTAVTTASNVICIGAFGQNVDNSCFIANIFDATSASGIGVFINPSGQLGTTTSSKRFKEDIKRMDKSSEALFSLTPVTFHYKKKIDPAGTSQFGLVAEDVEKVNPDLVVRDNDGKPYSVRYDQVNSMLLNEFLKEHRTVQQQGVTIAELKGQIASLTAIVKQQTTQIQNVSAQLELNRSASQTIAVGNP